VNKLKPCTWYEFKGFPEEVTFGGFDIFPNKVKIIYIWIVLIKMLKEIDS